VDIETYSSRSKRKFTRTGSESYIITAEVPIRQAATLLLEKTFHRESALLQDNSQWTGENQLISPEDIIRLDELDRLNNKTLNFDSIEASRTRIRELSSVYYT
jgi:hypothetical protein